MMILIQAFWFIASAYAANAFPPLLKGKKPIDFNRKLGKYRLLGNGKTIEGSIGGVLFGMAIGFLQILSQRYIPEELGLMTLSLPLIFLLSFGAILGDIVGSFIKRRFGVPSGNSIILLDQLDFLIFSIFLSSLIMRIDFYIILILIVLTPLIHWIANMIGYFIKIKKKPW